MGNPMKPMLAAAEAGDATAQFNLGTIYDNRLDDNGKTVRSSRAEAIKWLRQAAEQGLPQAQTRLAEIYAADGPDVRGNQVRACTWFLRAATSLSGARREQAQAGYDRISAQMDAAQVATAQRLARRWKPKLQNDMDSARTQ